MGILELLHMAVFGFHPAHEELNRILGGGGVVSMVKVAAIVCLSSSYAGIFQGTGMLERIREMVKLLSKKVGPFGTLVLVSASAVVTACNQTLAIMVTWELGKPLMEDREEMALAMEDSVVVMAALVPWSIACAVPLESVGAPMSAIPAAVYLWLLPLWH
ncbi:Na+/H+ antiporter NhaC family protein [uncultured Dialister sp.]|uniref:Na+/H+ antiporter NhaC family protein n=1 Tax=uncultured Dialister sp. TaxID=278064 RepID=UPI0034174D9D